MRNIYYPWGNKIRWCHR